MREGTLKVGLAPDGAGVVLELDGGDEVLLPVEAARMIGVSLLTMAAMQEYESHTRDVLLQALSTEADGKPPAPELAGPVLVEIRRRVFGPRPRVHDLRPKKVVAG